MDVRIYRDDRLVIQDMRNQFSCLDADSRQLHQRVYGIRNLSVFSKQFRRSKDIFCFSLVIIDG